MTADDTPHADTPQDDVLSVIDSATLLAAAPDACMVVDSDGIIRALNGLGADMFGYPTGALIGQPIEQLIPEQLREVHVRHRRSFSEAPRTRSMGSGLSLTARRADSTVFPVEVSLSPLEIDGEPFAIAAIRDVTQQTRIRSRLQVANREAALAEDRERMARDLHDTVIQEVFAVGLSLQSAASRIDDPMASARVSQAIEDLDRVIRDIRTAIFGLTSHRDWGRGVRGEVLRIAADQRRALGFEPTVAFVGDVDGLPDDIVGQMLPVLKEAVSNVARHAQAQRCDVVIDVGAEHVTATVTDDGIGMSGEPSPSPSDPTMSGHGLPNLSRRAERLGGRFEIGPAEIVGSRATWVVPLPSREQAVETDQ